MKGVGKCVPGVGILGGAMGLCADALDPSTKLSHLKEESKKLRKVPCTNDVSLFFGIFNPPSPCQNL